MVLYRSRTSGMVSETCLRSLRAACPAAVILIRLWTTICRSTSVYGPIRRALMSCTSKTSNPIQTNQSQFSRKQYSHTNSGNFNTTRSNFHSVGMQAQTRRIICKETPYRESSVEYCTTAKSNSEETQNSGCHLATINTACKGVLAD